MEIAPPIFTVARLNQEARLLLETGLGTVWVSGELSNLSIPTSGHWYFSLKDSRAQVRCAMFKGQNQKIHLIPKEGDEVLIKGKVSLYEPRGDYQLIAEHLELMGTGILQRAFEQLKQSLQAEGLFDVRHKKSLPNLPNCVGIITSSTGAALYDILTVLRRRFSALPIIIYPCFVQGDMAKDSLVSAIKTANYRGECDVLILARGGGSLEDLWPFNEESVARAIFDSTIPIVSGVGHEIDVTIADFVADVRAATPSAAAELVSPHTEELSEQIRNLQQHLNRSFKQKLQDAQQQLKYLSSRLISPVQRLQQHAQQLDYLQKNLITAIEKKIIANQQKLALVAKALHAYSPLGTLARGYVIAEHEKKILFSSKQVNENDIIDLRLYEGKLICQVMSKQ